MFSLYEYQQLDNSTIVKNGVKKIVSVVCILKLKFGLLFACMKILNGFFFPVQVYGARPIRRWLEKKVVTEL